MARAEVSYPTSFAPDLRLLTPDMGLGDHADGALYDLAEHGFVAALGVHERQLGRLATMASEPHIQEYCPSDSERRFSTPEMAQEWQLKGRVMVGIYDVEGHATALDVDDIPYIGSDELSQVAYGWFGPETNEHIPTAPITTAYRVGERGRLLSRLRRHSETDHFKLGLPLGRLVTAAALNIYDVRPSELSLETWKSNGANSLYDILGFVQPEGVESVDDVRPTLRPIGDTVNGNVVYFDLKKKRHMVGDTRLFKVLANAV
jgi:hypothetical protein